jgi:hypothetical protein
VSGQHAGPRRWRSRQDQDQPAGPDYPGAARHAEDTAGPAGPAPDVMLPFREPAIMPAAADIAAARKILHHTPAALGQLTLGEFRSAWDQLLWAGCVLDAALEIAAPSAAPEMLA